MAVFLWSYYQNLGGNGIKGFPHKRNMEGWNLAKDGLFSHGQWHGDDNNSR